MIEQQHEQDSITVEEVQRVLEVGRILLSVLTLEEIEQLRILPNGELLEDKKVTLVSLDVEAGSS